MFARRIVVLLTLGVAVQICASLKIQNPADDLPKELKHPKQTEIMQVGYLNLDDKVVSSLYEPDNFYGNMELINGMLESERKSPTLLKGVKKLDEVVDLFVSLSSAYERCDFEGYKSLAQNYRAVDGRSHELYEHRRPVEKMIYDYALEHARECSPKYVENFKKVSEQPSASIVAQVVDEVLKGLDADSLMAGENGDIGRVFKPKDVIEVDAAGLDLTNHAFHTIAKNIERLIQGKSEMAFFYPTLKGSSKISLPKGFETNIFDKYLIVPCEQYNEVFRDVFAPARFDSMIEEDVEPIFPTESERFNTAWIQYQACKHLASKANRSDLLSIVKQAVKSLAKNPAAN